MTESPSSTEEKKLIDLRLLFKNPLLKLFAPLIEFALSTEGINDIYSRAKKMPGTLNFFDRTLHAACVDFLVSAEDRERIPKDGPLIVVSNHPFGGIDGMAIGSLLLSVRADTKFLINYLMGNIDELRPFSIPVDPFGGTGATKTNIGPMKDTLKWLKNGGCLGTFPSGTVSHLHLRKRHVTDPQWNDNVAGLVRHTGANVLPIFIHGRNSNLFQFLGLLHPRLRTALLVRELLRMKGKTMELRVGQPIQASRLAKFESDAEMISFMRLKTYNLRNRTEPEKRRSFIKMPRLPKTKAQMEPIIPEVPPDVMAAEIATLPAENMLVSHGDMKVFMAEYGQIPNVIKEIGRLREKTFRAVGEGTGKQLDIDNYDSYYLHLFMWNAATKELVGGYRLGRTDKILSRQGPKGIYTTSLFRFKDALLERLSPALEMGRSFIREEYQRKPNALPLIWRGIGEYVSRFPRYRVLFGPVSISGEYKRMSRDLMVHYLRNNTLDEDLHPLVKARRPPRNYRFGQMDKKSLRATVKDIEDISAMVSDIETDRKGVPVLLKHYLKLNATILSFNVDKDFCNVIDGLIVVDLMRTDPKILKRFMGDEACDKFMQRHKDAAVTVEA
ncbi:MAG: GNAT family N-acyltransferase [Opitutales bacterium]|jgi:putative hemolysin